MRLRVIYLILVLGGNLGVSQTTSQMSYEETVVRTAYARLSFAVQVNEIHRAISDSEQKNPEAVGRIVLANRLKKAELGFVLSEFKVGNVTDADIANMRYEELVTKPSGEALDIGAGIRTFETDEPKKTQSAIATVQWHAAQNITEDWTQTWAAMLPQVEHSTWLARYAAFKVKVSFAGRSREYHAMFVFGHDPAGTGYVVPVDTITGLTGALNFFVTRDAYPEALIEGGVGKNIPAVREWLTSLTVTGKTHSDNCEPATLKCGISREDLKKLQGNTDHTRYVPFARPMGSGTPMPRLLDASFRLHARALLQSTTPTTCSDFNTAKPHVGVIVDYGRHVNPGDTSNHALNDIASTSCTYADGASSTCDTTCNVTVSSAGMTEVGQTTGFCHQTNKTTKDDTQSGTGAGANCGGGAGGGVKECLGCLCGVTISSTSNGATVSFSSDGFYTASDGLGQQCAAMMKPTPIVELPPPPPPDKCTIDPTAPDCPPLISSESPIIIDTTGKGFQLTSAANGVLFDIRGDGQPIQLGWTAVDSGNAFLALPGSSGIVTNGTQLFGNFTPQPASARPNGFAALTVYDQPDHGGNGDQVIDQRDQIFSSLRLWIDENHDGICQPQELHPLPELGVFSLNLEYVLSHRVDEFGNVFRYLAKVNAGAAGKPEVGPKAYDVFLTTH